MYRYGRLIVDGDQVSLSVSNHEEMPLDNHHYIGVWRDDHYMPITLFQAIHTMSTDGWPLFAGLDARISIA